MALRYGQKNPLPPAVRVVRYGGPRYMALGDYFRMVWLVLTRFDLVIRVFREFESESAATRAKLTLRYLPLASLTGVNVIHIQWLGWVPDFHWLRKILNSPLVASARGSQVTVYPFTRPGYAEVIRKALRLTDACHLVSEDLRSAVLKLGADEAKLFVNYNGIDLDVFKPLPERQNDNVLNSLQLVSVGSLIWRKGYFFQIAVVQQLLRRNVKVKLTIVGDGTDREGLLYSCRALGVEEFVVFKGQLNEIEIANLLAQSDVYVSTSMAEGLPNSVVEAAASALPVVAFECEGIHEIVEHGVSGYVVPAGSIDEMVNFLEILLDHDSRTKVGQSARKRVEQRFNQQISVDKMIIEYQRLFNGG